METEYIDKAFRPDLLDNFLTKVEEREWLSRWGMDMIGVPVPMTRRLKAAVWRGTVGTTGEVPVLAVVAESLEATKPGYNIWYIGVVALEGAQNTPLPLVQYLEAAEFGPSKLLDALSLLTQFAPPDRYNGILS